MLSDAIHLKLQPEVKMEPVKPQCSCLACTSPNYYTIISRQKEPQLLKSDAIV